MGRHLCTVYFCATFGLLCVPCVVELQLLEVLTGLDVRGGSVEMDGHAEKLPPHCQPLDPSPVVLE